MLSENFCGSFLPDLASKEKMATISGIGWAIGYFGGFANLLLVKWVVTSTPENLPQYISQNQMAMLLTGLFIIVAAVPTFLFLKDRSQVVPGYEKSSLGDLFRAGFERTIKTFKEAKSIKLLAFFGPFFYYAGLSATINFAGIFAGENKF